MKFVYISRIITIYNYLTNHTCITIYTTITLYIEWGNPNEEKYHEYMKNYSPIDNITQDNIKQYPALLVTTGLHDPRVAYWEGAKFVSKIRATSNNTDVNVDSDFDSDIDKNSENSKNICLLKTDMSTGHFSASDRYKYLKEMSTEFAFMLKHML